MILTESSLNEVMHQVLYSPDEAPIQVEGQDFTPPEGAIQINAPGCIYYFHPERIKTQEEKIKTLLGQVGLGITPEGGWEVDLGTGSYSTGGSIWTTSPFMVEALISLGVALGFATWNFKEDWRETRTIPRFRVNITKTADYSVN